MTGKALAKPSSGSSCPRLLIAGTHSGAGKTTFTVGLMAELRRRGLTVQGFKVGPDYIDPTFHRAVTGRSARNLDTWMVPEEALSESFFRGCAGADVAVIEGVMGLYDGKDPRNDRGSAAQVARLLQVPVILVVDVHSMARSAAAVVLGFQRLDPRVRIVGVVANRVGSPGHAEIIRTAVEGACGIPVLGALPRRLDLAAPERHLGLIPALERGELSGWFDELAQMVRESVNVDRVVELARSAPALGASDPVLFARPPRPPRVNLAVAWDAAFHFYYAENLELLEYRGARLLFFSPLAGEEVPEEADGLYIGGGFPEEFAQELSSHRQVLEDLRRRHAGGLPIYAECGGLMYLSRGIETAEGHRYPMAGLVPAWVRMQRTLAALGYREVVAERDTVLLKAGEKARGHEFHYSHLVEIEEPYPWAYRVSARRGWGRDGYAEGRLLAAYTHLHFGSHPDMVDRWLDLCARHRAERAGVWEG
ncbi:cobyrinate a,c-diamide synthase [Kyrpidia spormannii]|uniref:Cobyrinate a,c-diamide synthase n=1 Tax=Kyrpidia spormannii TaxID=2055160 RepID=A0A6F9E470_9BACL|nr:cobyrinate a,c-diamide synthase [Kyrpidia spormannii]CAB3391293.1 Cobyrinate a,c-diamide synthase [Kyrpidia spormannii]